MRILQINTSDREGGAAKIAYDLHKSYRQRGYSSYLTVANKHSTDPNVLEIPQLPPSEAWIAKIPWKARELLLPLDGKVRGANRMRKILYALAGIRAELERRNGWE